MTTEYDDSFAALFRAGYECGLEGYCMCSEDVPGIAGELGFVWKHESKASKAGAWAGYRAGWQKGYARALARELKEVEGKTGEGFVADANGMRVSIVPSLPQGVPVTVQDPWSDFDSGFVEPVLPSFLKK